MIEVSHFSFRYGRRLALDDVNLTIGKGESVILAGANGSGKTTLLRAVSGVLMSRSGSISVDETGVGPMTREKTAYIPASLSFYDSFRIKDAIGLHGGFYRDFEYREIGGFRFDRSRKVGSLSRGEKTLFYLTLALSTSPGYLLIDDVVHFLDPHLREIFLGTILQMIEDRELGLVIAAQVPLDIEGLIDRVVVLDKGKTVLDESVENLKRTFVRIYSDEEHGGLPVVFKKEWQGMKELYVYPYTGEGNGNGKDRAQRVEHLNLAEILRAFIGGEYDQN